MPNIFCGPAKNPSIAVIVFINYYDHYQPLLLFSFNSKGKDGVISSLLIRGNSQVRFLAIEIYKFFMVVLQVL